VVINHYRYMVSYNHILVQVIDDTVLSVRLLEIFSKISDSLFTNITKGEL